MAGILDHLTFEDDFRWTEGKEKPYVNLDSEETGEDDEDDDNLPAGLGIAAGLGNFIKQDRFPDVYFLVGDEKDESKRARIGAHRVILAARSPVFEAMLYPAFEQQREGGDLKQIEVKGVKGDSFRALLQGIYSGKAEITPQNISDLSKLARKYQIQVLNRACTNFLKHGVNVRNACLWFSKSEPGSPEKKSALHFIEDNCSKVIHDKGWAKLTPLDVSTLVKSNQLEVEELELWLAILRWLDAEIERKQNPEKDKEKDKEKDSDKDKEKVKKDKDKDKDKEKEKDVEMDPEVDMEKYIERQIQKELAKEKKKGVSFAEDGGDGDKKDVTPEEKRRILKDILPYVRFPLMNMEDLISKVAPTKLLPSDHLLAIYAYVGAKETGRPKFDLHYPTQERNPRKPSSHFVWDGTNSSVASGFGGFGTTTSRTATVSESGLVLASTGTGWVTANGIAQWYPKTGVYDWEVLLEQYDTTNSYNVVIGMVPATGDTGLKNVGPIAYSTTPGWGFITGQGQLTQYNSTVTYGTNSGFQCRQGDRVGVRYDSDRGVVIFFRNNVQVPGQAFRVTGSTPLRPAVSLVQQQRLRLNFKTKFPKTNTSLSSSSSSTTTSTSLGGFNFGGLGGGRWDEM